MPTSLGADVIALSAARCLWIDQPKEEVVEELWGLEREVVEVPGSIHRSDIDEFDSVASRLDEFEGTHRLLGLIWIRRIEGALAEAPAAIEPEVTLAPPPRGPAPDLRPRVLDVELLADKSGRSVYRLLAPYARLTPVGVRLEVQVLNRRPTHRRTGVLTWRAELPGLEPVTQQPQRRALVTRQGELLRIDLPQPVEPGDLLYIPNGWWHATRSCGVSVSVNGACAELPPTALSVATDGQ